MLPVLTFRKVLVWGIAALLVLTPSLSTRGRIPTAYGQEESGSQPDGSTRQDRPRFFQISIEGLEPAAKLRQVLEHEARRAESFAASWFHDSLSALVTIEWATHSGPLQRYGWNGSQTVAGLAVPTQSRIVLFAPALSSRPDRIRSVLLHEMVHLHVHASTAHGDLSPPRWLDEGLAMWISGTWDLGFDWRANESSLLTDASAAGTLLPFEKLDSSFPEGPFFALAYAQSYAFVSWLVERHGEDSMRSLLRGLDRNLDFDAAFAAAMGNPFPDEEREWRRTVERRGIFGFLPSSQALWIFGSVLVGLLVLVRFIQVRRRLAKPEEVTEPLEFDPPARRERPLE